MRVNEPINDRELDFPDGEPLVSRTDPGGRIEFANHVFVEVSGFTEQELVGSAHNIVRHPHMPPAAFADLWATIKAGRPWDGLVKNRAKSGAFYWVRANVTPVVQDGAVTGFISIRCKPSRQQIAAADQVYSALRAGTAKGIALSGGDVVRLGPRAWLGTLWHSVRGRLLAVTLAAVLVTLAVGWLGFAGMAASNDALRRVYERDLVSVNGLRTISDRIRDNRNHMAQLTIALGRGDRPEQVLAEREPAIRANMAQIAGLLSAYWETPLVPGQSALLQKFDAQYSALLRDGIEPALAFARRGEGAQLDQLFQKRLPPVFQAAFDTDRDLVNMQIELGRTAYTAATESLHWRLIAGALAGLAGLAACTGAGLDAVHLGARLYGQARGASDRDHARRLCGGDQQAEGARVPSCHPDAARHACPPGVCPMAARGVRAPGRDHPPRDGGQDGAHDRAGGGRRGQSGRGSHRFNGTRCGRHGCMRRQGQHSLATRRGGGGQCVEERPGGCVGKRAARGIDPRGLGTG